MKKKLIISAVLTMSLVLFLGFLVYHTNGQYKINDGKLFVDNREVSDINMQQYTRVSNEIVKDSSHVFYNGKIVKDIDAPTFESLGTYSLILRDKNGLYVMNNALLNLPLKRIDLSGIDTASFQQITSEKGWTNAHFYGDNNSIFFAQYGKLRSCPEIDRSSFQIVDFYLFKDRNQVYYLTQFMDSDTKKRTASADYAVLKGADGETFHKISEVNDGMNHRFGGQIALYEDKNEQWEIYVKLVGRGKTPRMVIRKVK